MGHRAEAKVAARQDRNEHIYPAAIIRLRLCRLAVSWLNNSPLVNRSSAGLCPNLRGTNHCFKRANSMLSTNAWSDAVIMFSLTPTVPHSRFPSLLVINTRVFAAVPEPLSMMRTL